MLLEQVPVLSTPSLGPSRASNGTRGGPATQQKKSPSQDNASTPGSSNSVINGSSTSSAGPTSRKRQADSAKRKRSSMSATPSDDHDQPTTPTTGSHTVKEKKKKAILSFNRPNPHSTLYKAHLTCDDDTCAEGHRKKAKYLLDDEELDALKRAKEQGKQEPVFSLPSTTPQSQQDTPDATHSLPTASTNTFNMSPTLFPPSDPLFNLNFDHSYPFDSTAANMEYSMLSAILGNPSAQEDANHIPPSPPPSTNLPLISNPAWPNIPLGGQSYNNFANGLNGTKLDGKDGAGYLDPALAQQTGSEQQLSAGINPSSALQFRISDNTFTPLTPPASDPTPASPSLINLSPDIQAKLPPVVPQTLTRRERSAKVYSEVHTPFDYVDGYHYLMQYLQGRFDKMDILRIVRALAIFRPSLIALQMDLSPEDEVFAEKCFQRSLIELEKLISFSGTPTVVWRRTGEICLVGVEFTMLTEWTADDLVKKRKFIYELFEHQSVVEYWEKFASHAFESSSQSVNCHCVLLKPSGEPVPCAFCFSIRRDVFDLPNVVIGQWLPLL
ncbi:Transcriptional regulator of nonfermentable carbon utilization [Tulasnella sp. 424]|nr:Transcriptional regulator of nonfermentable carbon utilization [Tulasnella sp. 424]